MTIHGYFAAYFHNVIFDVVLHQRFGHYVACKTFGYGTRIKHDAGVVFDNFAIDKFYLAVTDQTERRIETFGSNKAALVESEPP